MDTTTFDTPGYVKKLEEAGFTRQQAETQAEALKSIMENQVATKQDLRESELRLQKEIRDTEMRQCLQDWSFSCQDVYLTFCAVKYCSQFLAFTG